MASLDDRRTAISIITPTAERHGFTVIDAEELRDLPTNLLAYRAALDLLLGDPTEAVRDQVRQMLAELAAADADA